MYNYIYDLFLSEKKYTRTVASIETRLTHLGLNGRARKATPLQGLDYLIKESIDKLARTIVIIGNDFSLNRALQCVKGESIALGYIPVGAPINIARVLGIPPGVHACDILSSRSISRLNIGKISNRYFLCNANFIINNDSVACDSSYRLTPIKPMVVNISNIDENNLGHSLENIFTLIAEPLKKSGQHDQTILATKKITVDSGAVISVELDGEPSEHQNFSVELIPDSLNMIVGKERQF